MIILEHYVAYSKNIIYSGMFIIYSVCSVVVEGRVGSKGELFPPKEVREKLGLRPGMRVIYRVEDGRLVVEPVPSLEDVLEKPSEVEVSLEEFYRFRRKLSREAEL